MKSCMVLALFGAAVLLALVEAKPARDELRELLQELLLDKRVPIYTAVGVKPCGAGCLKIVLQQTIKDDCGKSPSACQYDVWVYKAGQNSKSVKAKRIDWGDGTYEAKSLEAKTKYYLKVCRLGAGGKIMQNSFSGKDECETVSGVTQ